MEPAASPALVDEKLHWNWDAGLTRAALMEGYRAGMQKFAVIGAVALPAVLVGHLDGAMDAMGYFAMGHLVVAMVVVAEAMAVAAAEMAVTVDLQVDASIVHRAAGKSADAHCDAAAAVPPRRRVSPHGEMRNRPQEMKTRPACYNVKWNHI